MRKKISAALLGVGMAATAVLATGGGAQGHGYSEAPTSRQSHCAKGAVTNCGAIQWEPQSVEGPKGFPARGPQDGTICAGGNGRFAQLDDPRGGNWPTTKLRPGQGYTFNWRMTAPHRTSEFQYYITKNGWDPSKRLTRADLEPQPFMTVPMGGRQPAYNESHQGTVPTGKSGKHIILGVWNIYDTANAFYACADVEL
ncbi:lytic polysaccharide monooxygenase auxiliary activity family 9 protein [Streptomyces alkaliterrae]|uniref:Chitin-binding protein n=1 Tax=Streptomyces alkaliterrae TaxID=2213162 RepID=A0A5P0YM10_9ACTN|nr:lytic polysaccharide monooxygenase auxiliary activity family 9 protein [Streptomyces alkaliterrae]MBB1252727.1 lytic polysaccharide monooxygenase [Streptomyces alkaliterrae]MBB1259504.1 lytic polysaccharide monooxygenase [Streptomyces alkaliterrae]MQS00940.1 chitin-binding protein [Streptomyces alkaliterrae]